MNNGKGVQGFGNRGLQLQFKCFLGPEENVAISPGNVGNIWWGLTLSIREKLLYYEWRDCNPRAMELFPVYSLPVIPYNTL